MGSDKGLMPFLGEPLIQRVIDRVAKLGAEIIVTTNQPSHYPFVKARLVRDVFPGTGALGGLYTALSAARYPLVAVVACDMPFAKAELFSALLAVLIENAADAVVPQTGAGYEPLHAVYRREACLPAIRAVMDAGERRLITWFPLVTTLTFCEDQIAPHDPHGTAFLNVNTPEQLREAEALALSQVE